MFRYFKGSFSVVCSCASAEKQLDRRKSIRIFRIRLDGFESFKILKKTSKLTQVTRNKKSMVNIDHALIAANWYNL
jgi:hypothetical protein